MGDWAIWAGFGLLVIAWIHTNFQLAIAAGICSAFYLFGHAFEDDFTGVDHFVLFILWDAFWAISLWMWARGPLSTIALCVLNIALLGMLPLALHWFTEGGYQIWKLYFPFMYLPVQMAIFLSVAWSIFRGPHGDRSDTQPPKSFPFPLLF